MAVSKRLAMLMCVLGLLVGSSLAQECGRDKHNSYRALHGVGSLKWDKYLTSLAQANAQRLAANKCQMKGSTGGNAFACFGAGCGRTACTSAVDYWYQGGVSAYKFTDKPYTDNRRNFLTVGTFTQVVWKSATKVGCAMVEGSNCAVVSCFYDTGNIQGDRFYKDNVLKAGSKPTDGSSSTGSGSGSGSTIPKPVKPDSQAKDQLPYCAAWAADGYCKPDGPEYRFENTDTGVTKTVSEWCPASCAVKKGPKLQSTTTELPQCKEWAAKGMCTPAGPEYVYQHPTTMEIRGIVDWCPLSCPYTPPGWKATNIIEAPTDSTTSASRKLVEAEPVTVSKVFVPLAVDVEAHRSDRKLVEGAEAVVVSPVFEPRSVNIHAGRVLAEEEVQGEEEVHSHLQLGAQSASSAAF